MVKINKLLLLVGIIGPVIFILLDIFVLGLFYPGYDYVNESVSAQGAIDSPVKFLANFAFFILGFSLLCFGSALYRLEGKTYGTKVGSLLLASVGILVVMISLLPADPSGTEDFLRSTRDMAHEVVSNSAMIIPFISIIFMMFFPGKGKKSKKSKDGKWGYLFLPIAIIAGIAIYLHLTDQVLGQGLSERIGLSALSLLVTVASLMFYRNYKDSFEKKEFKKSGKNTIWSVVTSIIIIVAVIGYVAYGEVKDYNDSLGWANDLQENILGFKEEASQAELSEEKTEEVNRLLRQADQELADGNLESAEELILNVRDILDEEF